MAQVLSPGFLAQLKTVIRRVLREQRNTVDAGSRRNRQAYHQAFIATEITAATNAKTSPGTGTAAIWVHDEQTDNLVDSGETVNIVNRYENITFPAGKYCHVRRVGGEWMVVCLDCPG